ncbi:MAG: 1-acyl-sn-glycerol-3-phosphate acyltransferase [Lachnospiraceae bacterium]|nr:1-acyl-sn-glycerol-3-phosphate acyltransferase [Candidatus Merdinaster equi]
MFHLISFFFVAVVIILVSIPLMLFLVVFRLFNERRAHIIAQVYVGAIMRIGMVAAGVKYTMKGRENIPKGEAVMFVPNHRSIWDIMLTYPFVSRPTAFISKDAVKKVPFINIWMWIMNCQFLNREDVKQGAQLILKCIDLVKSGHSVTLFAEGTRNKGEDETQLLEFHEGSFKIAARGGCAIVPVAIHNSVNIWEAHFPKIFATKVSVEFGKPFYISDLPKEKQRAAGAYTREILTEMVTKLRDEAQETAK